MASWEYKAINNAGRMLVGRMDAETRSEVLEHLERVGYTPVSVAETSGAPKRSWRDQLTPEPSPQHITGFTLDLAMLLKGGVTLDEALLILSQMESRRWLARLIRTLHVELSGGKSFSQVLAMHPTLFPPIYVKMIEVAEAAGRLEEALTGVARERQRVEALRRKFLSAMAYPAFLMLAAIGVLFFVLLFIVPQFEQAIGSFRNRLDPSSLRVFDLAAWLRDNLGIVGGAAAGILGLVLVAGRLGRGRNIWVGLGSRIPGLRTVIAYDTTLTFCRTLSILVSNGVDISSALRLIHGVLRDPAARDGIDAVIGEVRQGRRLSEALARHPFLPGHVVQMLRVGEESGNIADSADRIGIFYETKLETALGRVTAIIGPVMMMGVSVLIAWLIISVISALMSVNELLV